jgi:hypothetical protein
MERMKIKYGVRKAVGEGEDVCLLYDILLDGQTIAGSGWYQLKMETSALSG